MERAIVVLLVFGCVPMAAAEPRWTKAVSANFELFTTAGEKKAREAILYFEQTRSFLLRVTGVKPPARQRVRIVGFASEKEFKPYAPNAIAAAWAGGSVEHAQIVMGGISSEHYPGAIHEYVHILMGPVARQIPLWLNEGLAELFSTLQPVGKKTVIGQVIPGRLLALQGGRWLTLEALAAVDQRSAHYNERKRADVFYAESWALTHMLVLTEALRPKFPDFLTALINGAPQPEAFQRAYGKPMSEMWVELQAYMHRGKFNIGVYDVVLEKSAEEPEVGPAAPVEAAAALAGLLVDIGKYDEAEAAYQQIARQFPDRPEIPEGQAYLCLRRSQTKVALSYFAKAVSLGSSNPRLYFDYATLLGGAGDQAPDRVSLFRKALELDPEFADARYYLGLTLMNRGDYAEALGEFSKLKRVAPERAFHFFHAVAFASHQVGRTDQARAAVQRARQYAKDDTDRKQLDRLLGALEASPRVAAPETGPPSPAQAPAPPAAPQLRTRRGVVAGTLIQVDCLEDIGRLRVRIEGGEVRLEMREPGAIEVRGAPGGKMEFQCGPQRPRKVRIEYDPAPDARMGTVGVVRAIEFQ